MKRSPGRTRRKICVVTTSRADFGLLAGLMHAILSDPTLRLQVIAAGMHLEEEFGATWREIEAAGLRIDRRVPMQMKGESAAANLHSLALGMDGFAEALATLKPDILVLLGDRFELMAPALAALLLRIPMAHIHGGELSEGAVDDSIRHAITKLASLHFPATPEYRRRILQLGESPRRVFHFGAPGLDAIHAAPLMSRVELEHDLSFSLEPPVALVTYHPVTRSSRSAQAEASMLIGALQATGLRAIFSAANADAGGAAINRVLEAASKRTPERFLWVPHLGHRRYLSCLAQVSLMIGNSSSGITEAPSFRLPVVNIGDRQRGRVRAANILDVPATETAIVRGIRRALSPRFRVSLRGMRNPYDRFRDGRVGERIRNVLRDVPLDDALLKKGFHDVHRTGIRHD
jgi:UDP-hydrolysing UDP-N-acetyl-D-glucosamine 2-epimerase